MLVHNSYIYDDDYYKSGKPELPDKELFEIETVTERVKSESFKEFLKGIGENPKKWVKVMTKYGDIEGNIYQYHYWTNGVKSFFHGLGFEEFIPHW